MRRKILKFLGVGVLNTFVGYAVYASLVMLNFPYLASLFLATVAGVIFNYFSIGRLVFRSKGGNNIFYKFIAAYAMVYAGNALLLQIVFESYSVGPYLAQALCIPPSVIASWLLMNHWVYKT